MGTCSCVCSEAFALYPTARPWRVQQLLLGPSLHPRQEGLYFFRGTESSPESSPESRQGESHLPLCVRPADKGWRTLLYESVIYLPRCVAFGVLFFGISLFGRIRDFKGKCSEKLKCKVDAVNKSVVANPRGSILKLLFVMKVFWVFFLSMSF